MSNWKKECNCCGKVWRQKDWTEIEPTVSVWDAGLIQFECKCKSSLAFPYLKSLTAKLKKERAA